MGLPAAVSETKSPRLKNSQGRVYIISRGSTLIWNFIYDDNVVNGPDWGRSEVVFSLLPDQAALSICSPLCDHSQLTLLVNALEQIMTPLNEKSILKLYVILSCEPHKGVFSYDNPQL